VAHGEDALQTIILACVGLRNDLSKARATWLGLGDSGIPAVIPYLSAEVTDHLEGVVNTELDQLVTKLKRAVELKGKRPQSIVLSWRRIKLP